MNSAVGCVVPRTAPTQTVREITHPTSGCREQDRRRWATPRFTGNGEIACGVGVNPDLQAPDGMGEGVTVGMPLSLRHEASMMTHPALQPGRSAIVTGAASGIGRAAAL